MQPINYQIFKYTPLQIRTPFSIGRLCTDFSSPLLAFPATMSIPHGQAAAFADRLTIFPPAQAHKSPSHRLPTAFRLTTYWSSVVRRLKQPSVLKYIFIKTSSPAQAGQNASRVTGRQHRHKNPVKGTYLRFRPRHLGETIGRSTRCTTVFNRTTSIRTAPARREPCSPP